MGRLVEFELENGGTVLVEVEEHEGPARSQASVPEQPGQRDGTPTVRGLPGRDMPQHARKSFEEGVAGVMPAVENVIARLRSLAEQPDEVRVDFGLDLHAEAGAFVASASAGANFSVSMTWRRDTPGETTGETTGGSDG